MNDFYNIIKKICEELDIKITLLSSGWLIVLEKNNQIHYISGYKFDINNHGIGDILDDKGLFYDVMTYKKLPTSERLSFYEVYDRKTVLDYFKKHHNILIVKGNIGYCGNDVYLVNNEKDLFDTMDQLLLSQESISIEPYYDIINEYRVILLNNEVKVVFGKEKPFIIGDGIHSIKELAIKFNDYFRDNDQDIKNPDYIPKLNERIELDFKFNLSKGARMFIDIDSNLKDKLTSIAKQVTKELGITFGSVDIIHTKDNKLLVLEANSGVMMDNYVRLCENGKVIAYNVYKEAIKTMFNIK